MSEPGDGRTHYVVLGVRPTSGREEIRAAYLRLARSLHPDRFGQGSAGERSLAERRMREVTAAFAVLGDAEARRRYDGELAQRSGRRNAGRPPGPESRSARPDQVDDEDDGWGVGHGWEIDDDEDMVELTGPQAFLLHRGPVIVAIVIALLIFVGSAYAGRSSTPVTPTTTSVVCSRGTDSC